MRLTFHTDYGLRTLIYLASHPDRIVTTTEIGRAYGISKNHLVRVAQSLRDGGFIELWPGRSGGMTLARPPDRIRIGDVVRALEPDFRIVECFDAKMSACPISPVCALAGALTDALEAFLKELDRYTLGQVIALSGPKLDGHFLPVEALTRGRPVRGSAPRSAPRVARAARTVRHDGAASGPKPQRAARA